PDVGLGEVAAGAVLPRPVERFEGGQVGGRRGVGLANPGAAAQRGEGKQEGEEDPAQGGRSHGSGGFGRGEAKNVAHPPAAWVRASADSPNRPKRKGPPAQRGRPLSSFAGGRSRSGAGGVVRGVGELLLGEAV